MQTASNIASFKAPHRASLAAAVTALVRGGRFLASAIGPSVTRRPTSHSSGLAGLAASFNFAARAASRLAQRCTSAS
jgi:hypothetical protein